MGCFRGYFPFFSLPKLLKANVLPATISNCSSLFFFLKNENRFSKELFCVCCIYLCLIFCQSKLEVKKEAGESPPSEAACLCSPPPAKNQCASCGMEIQDRYLLKVRNLKKKKKKASDILCVGTNLRTTIIPSVISLFLLLLFFLFICISNASTHQCVLIPPAFLRRLIT